jgi:glycosyltransferase involved in cell wall biosynthesis
MKVLIVGNFLSGAGYNRCVCEELAARLMGEGWHVITTSSKPGRAARLIDMLATCWRRRSEYQVAEVSVFSGLAFMWAEAVCALLRSLGKPYVLTLHGGNLPTFARRWPSRVRRLLSSARAVTAPSAFLYEQLRPFYQDLGLLPNAIDLNNSVFRLRSHPEPKLIWVRAFAQLYNPMLAPRVLSCLSQEWPQAELTMIGPDKHDGSLAATRELASKLDVAERVRLTGAVAKVDVPRHLSSGDIFLNTTNADNTPVSVLEALANGMCVVSTNVGGLPYLMRHEHNALLVPPDDAEQMARAVRRVLCEPGLAAKLSAEGRALAERHAWEGILPRWKQLLTDCSRECAGARRTRTALRT